MIEKKNLTNRMISEAPANRGAPALTDLVMALSAEQALSFTPWKQSRDDFSIFIEDSRGRIVADVRSNAMGMAEHAKRARALAAAPELLEALRAVVAVADRETKEFQAARDAIAKAEGK